MKLYPFIKFCTFAALIYITLGDVFLPQPYSNNSREMREDINQYLVSLFPSEKLETLKNRRSNFNRLEQTETGINNPRFQ